MFLKLPFAVSFSVLYIYSVLCLHRKELNLMNKVSYMYINKITHRLI